MPTITSIQSTMFDQAETPGGSPARLVPLSRDSYRRPASPSPLFMTMAAGCGVGALWAGFPGCALGALALPLFGCDSDFRLQAEPTPEVTPPSPPDPEECEEVTITVDCDGDGFTNTFSVCEDDAWVVVTACGGETLPSDEEDCAPQNPEAYPGAPEIACSGADENCDGLGDQEWIALDDVSPSASLSAAEALSDPDAAPDFGENISYGDLNGDGAMDLIVSSQGKAHLFYGPAANDTKEDVTMTLASDEVPKTSVLDFNGDGHDDLVVNTNVADDNNGVDGSTFIIEGPLPQGVTEISIPQYSALTVISDFALNDMSSVGDLNLDHRDDLVMIEYSNYMHIIYGRDFPSEPKIVNVSEDPDASLLNIDYPLDFVSAAGDLNDDGYRDILVTGQKWVVDATTGEDWLRGMVYLLYGPFSMGPEHVLDESNTAVLEMNAVKEFEEYTLAFGESLAGLGDMNGDGFDDVMVGYPDAESSNSGLTYLILGGNDLYGAHVLEEVAITLVPPEDPGKATTGFSWILASTGDVNGDFFADAAIYTRNLSYTDCVPEDASPFSALMVLYGTPLFTKELRGQSRDAKDLAGTVYYDPIYASLMPARIYPRDLINPGLFDGNPTSFVFPSYGDTVNPETGEVYHHPDQIQVFNNVNP